MKRILALVSAFLVSSAFADDSRHMIEFNAENLLQATIGFDKSKSKGTAADNDTQLKLDLNYAYSIPNLPQLQLAGRMDYNKGTAAGRGDFEDYGLEVGAYWNFGMWDTAGTIDLMNSAYLSGFIGLGWANTYGGTSSGKDEVRTGQLALGKRMDLKRLGVGHVVYSPEIALTTANSTTGSSLEYSQAIELRLLQFSVFW